MDPPVKKRKLPKGAAPRPSGKRQRRNAPKPQAPARAKHAVGVDSLPWKTVSVPEMFDDAEGFYGLEEVEGVEVVRQGQTIQFMAAVASDGESDEFQGFEDKPDDSVAGTAAPNDPEATSLQIPAQTTVKPTEPKTKKAKNKQPKAPAAKGNDAELKSGIFAKLDDADAEASDIDTDITAWVGMNLSPDLLSAISSLKFSEPTAIQTAAIPQIIKGHDVIGKASTGSGKTLAFAIPIVEKWLSIAAASEGRSVGPVALILSPTRELAHQITEHIKDLCAGLSSSPYICSVTGGLSVLKQQRQLEKADIVIGTPGRLWEVLSSDTATMNKFKEIKFLVVDEADRLLSEGHFKEAEEILKALDRTERDEDEDDDSLAETPERQTLVFSATFNKGLQQKLAGKGRYDLMDQAQSMEYLLKRLNFRDRPKFIDVNPVSQMAEGLKEGIIECAGTEKDLYLYSLLLMHSAQRTLVFTNSISSVRRIAPLLQNLDLPALPLHSEMAQKARLRSIERFTSSKGNSSAPSILVATDVAARGLDIPGIDMVVHYHVPRTADAYVHRSGRTARAATSGVSILLCGPEEVVPTRRLVAKVHAVAQQRAAKASGANASSETFFIETVDIDRRIVSRLRDRVVLAKKIADANLAKEKGSKDDNWMKEAAEELGVEYDSDELNSAGKWAGRGSGRKAKEKEARSLSKAEMGALRSELKQLLAMRINTGVSEKYITGGRVDVDELLKGAKGNFLGKIDGLGLGMV